MSEQQTLWDTPNATSSPESGSGPTPSDSPDGPTTDPSSVGVVRASHGARQGKDSGQTTRATFGQRGIGSSASYDLTRSLASRLRGRADLLGSTLYRLTWKRIVTPSGRSIYRLAASARRTSATDCSSWPTPDAGAFNSAGDPNWQKRRAQCKETHGNNGFGLTLGMASSLAPWPTPRTVTGGPESAERKQELGRTQSGGGDLQAAALLASWGTPRVTTNCGYGKAERADGARLEDQAQLASWVTPASRDHKDTPGMTTERVNGPARVDQLPRQPFLVQSTDSGPEPSGLGARTEKPGRTVLNPSLSRWLQGLPKAWDELSPHYAEWLTATRQDD